MDRFKAFFFKNTSNKQIIAKNAFWLFASEGFSRVFKVVLVIYTVRVLGAYDWGVFSYALSLGSLLMIFSDIGLSGLITREIIQQKEGYRSFIATAFVIKSALIVASTIAVVLIGPAISDIPEAHVILPWIAGVLLFDAVRDFVLYLNTAFEKMERDMLVKSVMSIVTVLVGVLLLQIDPIPRSVAIGYAIGGGIGMILALWTVGRDMRAVFGAYDRTLLRSVIVTTLPFAAISLINTVMANTDIYLLGIWRDATEIGLYSSAQRIYQLILMVPVIIATTIFPLLSRLATTNNDRFALVLGKVTASMFVVGMPIGIGGVLLAPRLIPLFFGPGFEHAVPILQVLLVMLLAAFPLVLFSNSVFAYNGQKSLAIIYTLGMIANAVINIILIPSLGALGSALATLISTTMITGLVWRRLYRMTRFHVFSRLGRSIVALGSMIVAILVINSWPLALVIIAGALVYIGVLVILREPLIAEVRTLFAPTTPSSPVIH
jgi:O-antigen/teichoic acid export membrane protein